MGLLLLILAILIGVYGIYRIINGDTLLGVILVIVAFLVGPGGYSIFNK